MKQKLTTIVLGVLGLAFFVGCSSTNLRCLPCENAKVVEQQPQQPAVMMVPAQPVSTCLPCQQKQQPQVVQYVAPTPAPAPQVDCLKCVDGQPDYSKYQWY